MHRASKLSLIATAFALAQTFDDRSLSERDVLPDCTYLQEQTVQQFAD